MSKPKKFKWKTLQHNGIMFPPEYEKHNMPIIYKNKKIILEKDAEEVATLYAKYTESEYIKNKIFRKNFWNDWKEYLGKTHEIQDLENCDFSKIYDYILQEKAKKKDLTKEEKEILKKEKDKEASKYRIAIIDDKEEPIDTIMIEPPGLFIGRGCHPKMGRVKSRINPEQVIINIGKDAKLPEAPKGHKWGKIVHNHEVIWLVSWKDPISGKNKYVFPGKESRLQYESDIKKFDLARKLKKHIWKIRTENYKELSHTEAAIRQLATVLYLIDNLALRVGNEKGEDEADTVGVTSLRVEHIKFLENNKITLDFLGKDSVRYINTVEVDDKVYKNLKEFSENKNKTDSLFDKIDASFINKYLQSFMKKLTAKVFRTFNASSLFQKELNKITRKFTEYSEDDKLNLLLDEFNNANIKVAILCNHQKAVSKSFNLQIEKLDGQINAIKKKINQIQAKQKNKSKKSKRDNERIKKLKETIKSIKTRKKLKIELKSISLDTSKANYIDPRITAVFIKKHDIPAEKVYSKKLLKKFAWAFAVDDDWTL